MTYPNVDAMKKMSADMGPAMESMHIALDAVDDVVLGPDAVLITSPFHMTAKVKGKPEWKGQGVFNMEQLDPDPFLADVAKRGLPWHVEER